MYDELISSESLAQTELHIFSKELHKRRQTSEASYLKSRVQDCFQIGSLQFECKLS